MLSNDVNDWQQLFTLSVGLTIKTYSQFFSSRSWSANCLSSSCHFSSLSLHTLCIAFDFTRMLMSQEWELSAFSANWSAEAVRESMSVDNSIFLLCRLWISSTTAYLFGSLCPSSHHFSFVLGQAGICSMLSCMTRVNALLLVSMKYMPPP